LFTFTHTGQAGTGAALDPGAAPAKLAPPALALSSDTAPVIDNGPESVGGLSHGNGRLVARVHICTRVGTPDLGQC